MIFRSLILLLLVIIQHFKLFSQVNTDDELRKLVKENGQAEVSLTRPSQDGFDFLTRNFSVSSVSRNTIRLRLSASTIELFLKQKFNYLVAEQATPKSLKTASSLADALQWTVYPSYSQYLEIVKGFADQYPSLCKIDTIGQSINGKLVLALKISDEVNEDDESEPNVFYTSSMHGDETGGFILMLRLSDYLLKNYSTGGRVKDLVDNLEIWINPLANPDGTYRTGDNILSPVRFNANDYDLNRNFPDPLSPYDSKNVEQKETADMVRFLEQHRFVLSANFHSGEEVVNYPWDRWKFKYHADDEWFRQISHAYADTVHRYSSPTYMDEFDNGITRGADWYVIYGGRQDFVTGELQGREVTIELDRTYKTPPDKLETLWQNNYRSLLGYLENALYGIHGIVKDKENNAVTARVFIYGHDRDSSHVYSDTLSGTFIRMLSPGTYDLTFNAFGFRDTTISVPVSLYGRTDLYAEMTPLSRSGQDFPILYPNPAVSQMKAMLPNYFRGPVNIRIFGASGILLQEYEAEALPNRQMTINVSALPPGSYSVVFTLKPYNSKLTGRFIVIR